MYILLFCKKYQNNLFFFETLNKKHCIKLHRFLSLISVRSECEFFTRLHNLFYADGEIIISVIDISVGVKYVLPYPPLGFSMYLYFVVEIGSCNLLIIKDELMRCEILVSFYH